MVSAHWMLVLPIFFSASACSLAYLTDRLGDNGDSGTKDTGPATDAGGDGPTREAGGPSDSGVIDGTWSSFYDGSSGFDDLEGIWGADKNHVWAVGFNVIVFYDGSDWAPAVCFGVGALSAVWGSSSTDVWAVGTGTIAHFSLNEWTSEDAGAVSLNAVWGSGANDVWAAGSTDAGGTILHYDGSSWKPFLEVKEGVNGLWGSGPEQVWAVGAGSAHAEGSPLILEFGGTAWEAPAKESIAGDNDLLAVWGSGADSAWAVGTNQILEYTSATGWQTLPGAGPGQSLLKGQAIWGSGPNDIWSVGFGNAILHYDGDGKWTPVLSHVGDATQLDAVWGSSANDVWIVGTGGVILHYP